MTRARRGWETAKERGGWGLVEPCHCFKAYILWLLLQWVTLPDMQRRAQRRPLKIIIIIITIMRMPLPRRNKNWRNCVCVNFCSWLLMLLGSLYAHWSCLQTETAVEVSAGLFLFPLTEHLKVHVNRKQDKTTPHKRRGDAKERTSASVGEACKSYIQRKEHCKAVNTTLIYRQHT